MVVRQRLPPCPKQCGNVLGSHRHCAARPSSLFAPQPQPRRPAMDRWCSSFQGSFCVPCTCTAAAVPHPQPAWLSSCSGTSLASAKADPHTSARAHADISNDSYSTSQDLNEIRSRPHSPRLRKRKADGCGMCVLRMQPLPRRCTRPSCSSITNRASTSAARELPPHHARAATETVSSQPNVRTSYLNAKVWFTELPTSRDWGRVPVCAAPNAPCSRPFAVSLSVPPDLEYLHQ